MGWSRSGGAAGSGAAAAAGGGVDRCAAAASRRNTVPLCSRPFAPSLQSSCAVCSGEESFFSILMLLLLTITLLLKNLQSIFSVRPFFFLGALPEASAVKKSRGGDVVVSRRLGSPL